MIDVDNPKEIAEYISEKAPGTTVRSHTSGQDGTCWIVENGTRRLAIGVDPIDGGGISYASYWILSDGEQSDPIHWDGWEFGQDKIAHNHIATVLKIFKSEPRHHVAAYDLETWSRWPEVVAYAGVVGAIEILPDDLVDNVGDRLR